MTNQSGHLGLPHAPCIKFPAGMWSCQPGQSLLESTVELSNAENHNEDPVRVQESSELLICKLWPLPLNLDHPPTSRLPAPYLQPLQPASPASNMPHLLPPQGLCTFYSGLLEHLHGFLAHFLRHSPQRHHSKEPCVTLPPNP